MEYGTVQMSIQAPEQEDLTYVSFPNLSANQARLLSMMKNTSPLPIEELSSGDMNDVAALIEEGLAKLLISQKSWGSEFFLECRARANSADRM